MASAPDGAGSEEGSTDEPLALSIVVPAFNESERLGAGVDRLSAAVRNGAVDPARTEVIVVDDGSTDGTGPQASHLLAALPQVSVVRLDHNLGKGAAVRAGVARARGALVAYMDADMAIDPDQIPLLVAGLSGAELAIGSRSQAGSTAEGARFIRTMMGRAFTRAVNTVTKLSLGDTQCGFKGFRTPVARLLFHLTVLNGYAFDVELLSMARQLGFGIAEIPVRWRHVPGSRVRPIGDAVAMAHDVARSRGARRARSPIEALVVSGGSGPGPSPVALAVEVASPLLPVLPWDGEGALVLLPLCAPGERDAVSSRLERVDPQVRVRAVTVSFNELQSRAPVHMFGASMPITGQRSGCP